MADRYAIATGNYSNPAIWDNGLGVPTSVDAVRANGYTVTIDQSITVSSLRTSALSPAVGGGSFVVTATGLTIVGDIMSGTSVCLTSSTAITLTIIGNAIPSSYNAVNMTHVSSILNVVGNIYGNGYSFGGQGVNTNGSIVLVGDCVGSSNNNDALYLNASTSNATITGNVIGGSNGRALGGASGVTIVINGNVIGGVANAISQSGIVANIIVNGTIVGGANGYGINLAGGTLQGNFIAYGSTSGYGAAIFGGGGTTYIANAVFSSSGTSPVAGRVTFVNSNPSMSVKKVNNAIVALSESPNQADPSDVRNAVSYGNGLVGTCHVPPKASVALNVPVDDGVGELTNEIDAAAVATALKAELFADGTPWATPQDVAALIAASTQ